MDLIFGFDVDHFKVLIEFITILFLLYVFCFVLFCFVSDMGM